MLGRREEIIVSLGRVIVYGNPNYKYDGSTKEWTIDREGDKSTVCEVLDVQEVQKDRIVTSKYVLPLADASVSTNADGLVYSYNCSLPYLTETAHLAEVEQNIIMQQAFAYAGRTQPPPKTSLGIILLIGVLALLALIGMFK